MYQDAPTRSSAFFDRKCHRPTPHLQRLVALHSLRLENKCTKTNTTRWPQAWHPPRSSRRPRDSSPEPKSPLDLGGAKRQFDERRLVENLSRRPSLTGRVSTPRKPSAGQPSPSSGLRPRQ